MASLSSVIKMLPTVMSFVNICVWLLIVLLSCFTGEQSGGVQAWTTDVIPTLKIKYGEFFFVHWRV